MTTSRCRSPLIEWKELETGGQDMGAVLDADDGVYLRTFEPWIAHDFSPCV